MTHLHEKLLPFRAALQTLSTLVGQAAECSLKALPGGDFLCLPLFFSSAVTDSIALLQASILLPHSVFISAVQERFIRLHEKVPAFLHNTNPLTKNKHLYHLNTDKAFASGNDA